MTSNIEGMEIAETIKLWNHHMIIPHTLRGSNSTALFLFKKIEDFHISQSVYDDFQRLKKTAIKARNQEIKDVLISRLSHKIRLAYCVS